MMKNLAEGLTQLESQGIKLEKVKCKFLAESVEYLGHRVDAKGIHTSRCKVEAIQKHLLHHEMYNNSGLVHYYGKFIPSLLSLLQPQQRDH